MTAIFNLRAANNATFQWTRDLSAFAAVYNLSAATIRAQARVSPYAPDPPAYEWASNNTAHGQVLYDATTHLAVFVAPEADMARLQGDLVYDCRLEFSGGASAVIFCGRLRVAEGVTRLTADQAGDGVSGLGDTVAVEGERGAAPVPLPLSLSAVLAACQAAQTESAASAALAALTISITATQIPALTLTLNCFRTIGYAAAGDGGDAIYVKATSSGPMAVQDVSGQWWALAKTGEWSAKAWGAKGDNATDDTAALNAWLAGCVANLQNGFAPPGVYLHRGLTLNATGLGKGVVIRGAHAGTTIFRTITGTTADILRYTGSNGYGNQSRCVLADLTLDGHYFNSAHGLNIDNSGVFDGYPQAPDLVRVTVLQPGLDCFYYGVNAQNGVMSNCAGSHPGRNALNLNAGDNYFNRCLFYGANNVGLRIANAANNGAGLVRLTIAGHGMTTGQSCHVWSSIDAALGTWTVTVIDANTLDLQGSIFSGLAKSGGNCIPIFTVTGAANNGAGLIRIQTGAAHGFATGAQVWLKDVGGVPNANGGWVVTVIDATHFDLQGSQIQSWVYTSGGTARAFAANIFIGATGATGDNVLRDCNVYMGMFGTVLTNPSSDIFQQVGGSIDSNFLAGVTIQTYGISVAHAFTDTRFDNNSGIGAGAWSDIVLSNTGSTVAGGSHALGNQAVNYLVESDGTCTSPVIWRASFDSSGGPRTPWVNGAVNIGYDTNVGFARQSITLGGFGNLANVGAAAAGRNCNSSGNYSFCAGQWGNTRATYGFTIGQFADDLGEFSLVWGGYRFFQNGDNQVRVGLMASCVTTGTTPARLLVATGSSGIPTTPTPTNTLNLFYNYQSMAYDRITILCKNPATGDTKTWVVDNLVAKRGASQSAITLNGSSSAISPAAVYTDSALAACAVSLAPDTTNGGIAVTATGIAGTTLHWSLKATPLEVV